VVAATITLVGGIAGTARRHVSVRLGACAATVLLARVHGPGLRGGVTLLIAFGWWIRMRPWDAVTGLFHLRIGCRRNGMASLRCLRFVLDSRRGPQSGCTCLAQLRRGRLCDETTSAPLPHARNTGAPSPLS